MVPKITNVVSVLLTTRPLVTLSVDTQTQGKTHLLFIDVLSFLLSTDDGLTCVCNTNFDQGCAQNPFCSVSGEFAHCIIEVYESDMAVISQGCIDSFTSYFACVDKVIETSVGRLILCCVTDNCNSIEAVLAQVSPTPHTALTTPGSYPIMTLQPPSSSPVLTESPNCKLNVILTKNM